MIRPPNLSDDECEKFQSLEREFGASNGR